MKDVLHIEKMIEEVKRESDPITYQEKKSLLGQVDILDYSRACRNLGVEMFSE